MTDTVEPKPSLLVRLAALLVAVSLVVIPTTMLIVVIWVIVHFIVKYW